MRTRHRRRWAQGPVATVSGGQNGSARSGPLRSAKTQAGSSQRPHTPILRRTRDVRYSLLLAASATVLVWAAAPAALADTWNGSQSSVWSVGNNWDDGTAPVPNEDAIFNDETVSNDPEIDGASENIGSGTVQVDAGTLTIQGAGSLSNGAGRIANDASTTGAVTVTGSGSTWTNINELIVGANGRGGLNVEDGGTVSSSTGDIGSDSSGNGTVNISGTGSAWNVAGQIFVGNQGIGTLTVSRGGVATSTVAGGTMTVASQAGTSGTVNIGAAVGDAAVAPGTVNVDNVSFGAGTGLLSFNHSDNSGGFDFVPAISGNGSIGHRSGVTNLTGDASGFTGMTTVSGGTLNVNTDLGGRVLVNGGTLGGSGSVGATVVTGGTVAPGNSIGTMTVNGPLVLGGGTVLEVEVDAAGNSDKIIANSSVNLTGVTLKVLAESGDYQTRTDYTIIENNSSGNVEGTFDNVTTNYAFLTPSVVYDGGDGNDVVLTLLRTVVPNAGGGSSPSYISFCSVAETQNQCNVAQALDQTPVANGLVFALLLQTHKGAQQALNALSGEVHASVSSTAANNALYMRGAVMDRMYQADHMGDALGNGGPQTVSYDSQAMMLGGADTYDGKSLVEAPAPQPLAFWTQAFGVWSNFDTDGNAATASSDLGGFISGVDASIGGSWRVGLATGATFSNVNVGARHSSASVDTYHLGAYAGGKVGNIALRGGGMWGWSEIETSRAVVFPSFFERQTADYDADTGQIFGEIAYPTQLGGVELEPFAGLAYVSVEGGSFRERGGPDASLRSSGSDQDVGYTTVGLRAAKAMMWGAMQVTPHIEAAWLHAFDDITPGTSLAFASTGIGFDVDGVPLAEDSALLDAGVDFALSDRLSAGVSYSGQYADNLEDNAVKGRFTWLFN